MFPLGVQLVSHDFRLIDQVADEIWVCDQKKVSVWKVRHHQLCPTTPPHGSTCPVLCPCIRIKGI